MILAETITFYWSCIPGRFLVSCSGKEVNLPLGLFKGTTHEWHETLVETVIDCINQVRSAVIFKKGPALLYDLRVCATADIVSLFKTSSLFRPCANNSLRPNEPIGKISDWFVHQDATLPNDTIKIIASFDCSDESVTMNGEVKVLDVSILGSCSEFDP